MKKIISLLLALCLTIGLFAGCSTRNGTAEIIHTVIGSFGLVSVAPFTALCAGMMLTGKN